jgi:hypothetical protein
MDVATIYAARANARPPLAEDIHEIISKLKISFKPLYRKPYTKPRREVPESNWRESALVDVVRKVREKDDADYDEVSAMLNKLSKQTYAKLIAEILAKLEKRDDLFRLRVTTLLFDRGIRQTFFATLMADAFRDIAAAHPDALQDLETQAGMFDALYDTGNVTIVPSSDDAGFDAAILAWTKQKELKRGFAVYVGELYTRGLIPEDRMAGFVKTVLDDLAETIRTPKTPATEEHVDALVRFLFAVAAKVPIQAPLKDILAIPRPEVPSLTMKSRFKLEDTAKLSR